MYQGREDMAMIYSEVPCNAAGTFTTNLVKAAPVKWDQEIVYHAPSAQAVIINAGIANACTGAEGYGYCRATADAAADILKIPANAVLVASTGVIGMQIPIHKIVAGVQVMSGTLDGSLESGTNSARAIMTTDTKKKEITEKNEDYEAFKAALHVVNETLAKKIAGDGEGCTALFEVKIVGAESKELGSKSSGNQWKRRWTAEMWCQAWRRCFLPTAVRRPLRAY